MKFEKTTQYRSEEGIVFNLSQITLMESDRGRLRELHFGEAKRAHYQVNSMVVDMYDRMQVTRWSASRERSMAGLAHSALS
ncbi:hypothetical protein [Pseudomonas helvetica]|uniref:hypothetical protein n=1 Tax=Pseudomonas helvetica TaxID=3136738 RepID=UPI0032656470